MKKFIAIACLTVSTSIFAAQIPGKVLIDYFGTTCSSQGYWTQLAISDARSLMETLRSIRDDEDCKTVAGAISQLGNLENKLISLDSQFSSQIEIARLEAQEIEILKQISNNSDPSIVAQLNSSLRQVQLDKATYVAMDEAYQDYNGEELKSLFTQIIKAADTSYSTIVSNQLCLDKNPSLLTSATSLTTSVAASASMINPAFGIGLASLSDFVGSTVKYFRDKKYNVNIRKLADSSTINQGLKCAMETMTNRWCNIVEEEEFLKLEASTTRNQVSSEISVINKIYDKDIPVLLNWLEKVKSGSPASNTADAGRRERMFYREATLKAARSRGQGLFAENRPLYDSSRTNVQKYNVIKTIINGIRENLENRGSNPLLDIHSAAYAPYYLIGLSDIPTQNGFPIDFNNFNPFTQWPTGNYTPDFQLLINLYENWLDSAQTRVTQELNLVLQPDPLQILSIYSERTSNKWKQSPADSLFNIVEFIKNNKPEFGAANSFGELYDTTIGKLEKINKAVYGEFTLSQLCDEEPGDDDTTDEGLIDVDIIEGVMTIIKPNELPVESSNCDKLSRALRIIFEEAQLEFGPVVFKNRLETIIRVSIDEYIKKQDNAGQSELAQLLAANSYLDVLNRVQGTDDYGQIMADIKSAKKITLENMRNFIEVFAFSINSLFRETNPYVNSSDPEIARTYREERAQMCVLLASMPELPKSINKLNMARYCYGMKIESIQPDGPETEVITKEYLSRPFSKRSCAYKNYLERTKIYRDWGIKLEN